MIAALPWLIEEPADCREQRLHGRIAMHEVVAQDVGVKHRDHRLSQLDRILLSALDLVGEGKCLRTADIDWQPLLVLAEASDPLDEIGSRPVVQVERRSPDQDPNSRHARDSSDLHGPLLDGEVGLPKTRGEGVAPPLPHAARARMVERDPWPAPDSQSGGLGPMIRGTTSMPRRRANAPGPDTKE